MNSTGIPPHVALYKQLEGVQQSIDNLPPVLLDGMSTLIEKKGVAAGNITRDLLETTIESLIAHAGLAHTQHTMVESQGPGEPTTTTHYYDGKFHMLPKNFEFPKVGAFGAWQLWWFGSGARGFSKAASLMQPWKWDAKLK
ncbi:unnamed protein product [Phytophthora fragariaefolia]|uniref:Unnamed protein product n=1 Tax=Phytophthora fragariaefolia TaxID=1490495 RepID=A0A9W6XS41_9STRA|nr:unnamed protein product [Phytophthora fragariaefolia]